MEHDGSFDQWWASQATCGRRPCTQGTFYEGYNISREAFSEYPFHNGFNTGDIMVLMGTPPQDISKGDVIVYRSERPDPIIHRVIRITTTETGHDFRTKGDHNWVSYPFESDITQDRYIGRAVLRIPYLGWVKIGFVKLLQLISLP
ncbi:MAG: signal peptidase I [DPANN group archaeon]|nr:signal peptidase I [DPANN group archaeon]